VIMLFEVTLTAYDNSKDWYIYFEHLKVAQHLIKLRYPLILR